MSNLERLYWSYSNILKIVPKIKKYFKITSTNLGEGSYSLLKFSLVQFVSRPLLIIMAGVHGEEPAPTLAVFKYYSKFYKLAQKSKINLIIYPLVNSWGFDHIKRYTKTNINCADNWIHKKIGPTALSVKLLKKMLKKDIKDNNKVMFIDLHEDSNKPKKFYLYSFGNRKYEKALLSVAARYFSIAKDNSSINLVDGAIYEKHDGTAEDFMSHQNRVISSCCTETPSGQLLDQRIACNKEIIESTIINISK